VVEVDGRKIGEPRTPPVGPITVTLDNQYKTMTGRELTRP